MTAGYGFLERKNGGGKLPNADIFGKIVIGNNVHIGMNTIIMPGITIGNNVVIGCGAVVTHDIPNNSVAVGVPARVIETYDAYLCKASKKCDFTKAMTHEEKKQYLENKYNLKISQKSARKNGS